jgi:hypothetical protein
MGVEQRARQSHDLAAALRPLAELQARGGGGGRAALGGRPSGEGARAGSGRLAAAAAAAAAAGAAAAAATGAAAGREPTTPVGGIQEGAAPVSFSWGGAVDPSFSVTVADWRAGASTAGGAAPTIATAPPPPPPPPEGEPATGVEAGVDAAAGTPAARELTGPRVRVARHLRHASSPELGSLHAAVGANAPPPPGEQGGPGSTVWGGSGSAGAGAAPGSALERAARGGLRAVVSLQDLSLLGEPSWLHRLAEPAADVSAWLESVPSVLPLAPRAAAEAGGAARTEPPPLAATTPEKGPLPAAGTNVAAPEKQQPLTASTADAVPESGHPSDGHGGAGGSGGSSGGGRPSGASGTARASFAFAKLEQADEASVQPGALVPGSTTGPRPGPKTAPPAAGAAVAQAPLGKGMARQEGGPGTAAALASAAAAAMAGRSPVIPCIDPFALPSVQSAALHAASPLQPPGAPAQVPPPLQLPPTGRPPPGSPPARAAGAPPRQLRSSGSFRTANSCGPQGGGAVGQRPGGGWEARSDLATVKDYSAVEVAVQALQPSDIGEEQRRELRT